MEGNQAASPYDQAREFWKTVAEPMKVTDLHVGKVLWLEEHGPNNWRINRIVIVTKIGVDDDGTRHVTFRNAEPDEITKEPTDYMIAGR